VLGAGAVLSWFIFSEAVYCGSDGFLLIAHKQSVAHVCQVEKVMIESQYHMPAPAVNGGIVAEKDSLKVRKQFAN